MRISDTTFIKLFAGCLGILSLCVVLLIGLIVYASFNRTSIYHMLFEEDEEEDYIDEEEIDDPMDIEPSSPVRNQAKIQSMDELRWKKIISDIRKRWTPK